MKNTLLSRYDNFFQKDSSKLLLEEQIKQKNNQFIRINLTKKIDLNDFFKKNRIKYSETFLKNSFKIEKSYFNISSSIENLSGKIYIQDLASQIPVILLMKYLLRNKKDRGKKYKILDMAASPGSKTSQLADILSSMDIPYEITALEIEKLRLVKLINNIQKQKLKNISIINSPAENFFSENKFDIILLDAPCSGNLVGDSNWLNKRSLNGILNMAQKQKSLLENANKLLKKGGFLIYSTCSLEIEENEENTLYAKEILKLKNIYIPFDFPFETNPSKIISNKNLKFKFKDIYAYRFMPYLSKTQGFYISVFEKVK